MSDTSHHHVVPYRTYGLILLLLLVLTGVSVAVTQIELTRWATPVALLLATAKSSFVLAIFMHLKFENRMFRIFVGIMAFVFISFMAILFFDYSYR